MTDNGFDFDFNPRSLEGRSVLIAGGTGGLGAATAALLACEGAHLTVGYRSNRDRAQALKQALEARYTAQVQLAADSLFAATGGEEWGNGSMGVWGYGRRRKAKRQLFFSPTLPLPLPHTPTLFQIRGAIIE